MPSKKFTQTIEYDYADISTAEKQTILNLDTHRDTIKDMFLQLPKLTIDDGDNYLKFDMKPDKHTLGCYIECICDIHDASLNLTFLSKSQKPDKKVKVQITLKHEFMRHHFNGLPMHIHSNGRFNSTYIVIIEVDFANNNATVLSENHVKDDAFSTDFKPEIITLLQQQIKNMCINTLKISDFNGFYDLE